MSVRVSAPPRLRCPPCPVPLPHQGKRQLLQPLNLRQRSLGQEQLNSAPDANAVARCPAPPVEPIAEPRGATGGASLPGDPRRPSLRESVTLLELAEAWPLVSDRMRLRCLLPAGSARYRSGGPGRWLQGWLGNGPVLGSKPH